MNVLLLLHNASAVVCILHLQPGRYPASGDKPKQSQLCLLIVVAPCTPPHDRHLASLNDVAW